MQEQAGFSLIEVVALLVILALLGAMAVPRFSNMQESAVAAAKQRSTIAVKVAHSFAVTRLGALPTVTHLAGYVAGETSALPLDDGVRVTVNGDHYVVPTFTDAACSARTASVGDTVGCVGSVQ